MKKNELVAPLDPVGEIVAEIGAMSTAELRRELAESLRLTAAHLVRLAGIVRTLEERGEDLSDLRIGLLNHLRRIAAGQLLPEVVVRFAGNPGILTRIQSLPLPDQQRLALGEPVRLMVAGGQHLLADPLKLTREQVQQVFGANRLRDDQEQVLILQNRAAGPKKKAPAPIGRVRADTERGGLMVGKRFAPRAEIVEALAALTVPDKKEVRSLVALNVPMSECEHRALKMRSAESGRSIGELTRAAMRAAALI